MPTNKAYEAIAAAIDAHRADRIKDKPVGSGGPWRSTLWTFTRKIKSRVTDPKAAAEGVFKIVDGIITKGGGWSEIVPGMDSEEIYLEFISNWSDIKFREGEGVLDRAYAKAKRNPLRHKKYTGNSHLTGYAEFISLAGWLQVEVGEADIVLPLKLVAKLRGVTTRTVTLHIKKGLMDTFLIPVDLKTYPGKAPTYRFDADQFPELIKAMKS